MKICDALVLALKTLKVRYVFGVSGANIEHLHDAIARLGGDELEAILAKSESGAAFMADAHARVHRTLGVCCATSGGGMFNLLPGIAEAYAESVPLLAIIGQAPLTLEGRGAFQDSSSWNGPNAVDLLKATTKWTHRLERASDFWIALSQCVRQALSGRQGPVALLIPRDLYDQDVEDVDPHSISAWLGGTAVLPSQTDIDRFFDVIHRAERPALILGHGVSRSLQARQVALFAQNTMIPTATTLSARDLMPCDAPNYLGLLGAAGHPSVHEYLANETDLVIAVGTGLSVMARGPISAAIGKKHILSINVSDDAILRFAPQSEVIKADAGLFFQTINADPRSNLIDYPRLASYRRRVLAPVDAPYVVKDGARNQVLRQSEAIAILERCLPQDGHVLFDAGNCAAAALHWTQVPRASTSTIALGMGTMGYAIGGAIGAQLGSPPGTRTVSIIGDGAFLMSGLEIHTAIELQLPILFVIFNNAGHGMCVTRQQLYFEGRQKCSTYHDFSVGEIASGLAGELPCFVASVDSPDQLELALDHYLNNVEVPGVLEIHNYKEEWPPFAPFFKEVGPVLDIKKTFRETIDLFRGNK